MLNPPRKRALTVSFLNPSKNPPSSPTPRPSNPDFQPPQFSLPPSFYQHNLSKTIPNPDLNDSSLVPKECETGIDSILSSSAPSAPYSMRYRMEMRYCDANKLDINYPINKGSPSFELRGFESPEFLSLDPHTEDLTFSHPMGFEYPFHNDLWSPGIIKPELDSKPHTTPLTTRSSSTLSSNPSNLNTLSKNCLDPYHMQESDSNSSLDLYSDDDASKPNKKFFSTSPLLRYTLETMKLKGAVLDDYLELPEMKLDESYSK